MLFTGLQYLPAEVYFEIARYLSNPDLVQLSQTCDNLRYYFKALSCHHLVIESPSSQCTFINLERRLIPLKVFETPHRYSWFENCNVKTIIKEPDFWLNETKLEELIASYPNLIYFKLTSNHVNLRTDANSGLEILIYGSPQYAILESEKRIFPSHQFDILNLFNFRGPCKPFLHLEIYRKNEIFYHFSQRQAPGLSALKSLSLEGTDTPMLNEIRRYDFKIDYADMFSKLVNLNSFAYRTPHIEKNQDEVLQSLKQSIKNKNLQNLKRLKVTIDSENTDIRNTLTRVSELPDVFSDFYLVVESNITTPFQAHPCLRLPQVTRLKSKDSLLLYQYAEFSNKLIEVEELDEDIIRRPLSPIIATKINSRHIFQNVTSLDFSRSVIFSFSLFPSVRHLHLGYGCYSSLLMSLGFCTSTSPASICFHVVYNCLMKKFRFGDFDMSNKKILAEVEQDAIDFLMEESNNRQVFRLIGEDAGEFYQQNREASVKRLFGIFDKYCPMFWMREMDSEIDNAQILTRELAKFKYLYCFEMVNKYMPELETLVLEEVPFFRFLFTLHSMIKYHKKLKHVFFQSPFKSPTCALDTVFPSPKDEFVEKLEAYTYNLESINDNANSFIISSEGYSPDKQKTDAQYLKTLIDVEGLRKGYMKAHPPFYYPQNYLELTSYENSIYSPIYQSGRHAYRVQLDRWPSHPTYIRDMLI